MYLEILIITSIMAFMNIIFIPSINVNSLKKVSLFWSLMLCVQFCLILMFYNGLYNFQFSNSLIWFKSTNLTMNWGLLMFSIDGMSLFFIGLSMMLMPICMIMSWNSMKHLNKEFFLCLYMMMILLIAVFSMFDMLGFYILFEAMLIPMFLMMGIWGSSEEKVKAAFYFFFYTLIGSLLMLISMFKIYSMFGTTNYQNLILLNMPSELQFWLFLGFFASLAVKMPMMPVHIWLPQAHVEAPMAGSVLLAGMLLKLGGYGFMSFSYPLFPLASEYFTPMVMILSLMAMIYASFTTCSQSDVKSLMAYSSVAHMGLVTLSIFIHSYEGMIASMMMMMAHGLVSSGLFMCSSVIYVSHHSSTISYFSGLTMTMPIFSTMTLMLILANMGFPLTFNFIAEFFSILAAFNYCFWVGVLTCVGALLSTVYALYFYNSIYFGTFSPHLKFSSELLELEFQGFLPLVMLTILLGMFPNMLFKFLLNSSLMNISL